MNLEPDPSVSAFRAEVRAWLVANLPAEPLPSVNTAAGFAGHRQWERRLAGARLAAVSWPERYGGRDASVLEWLVFEEEYHRGGWLLSGQKTWSSRAAFADRAFGLFRSEPGAERHHGLTYLMFGLRAPGVTVRPIAQLDGEPGFAEIFLDDVFVPDADVIGAPGEGWRVAMSTASHERGLSLRSPGRFLAAADRLVGLWQRPGNPSGSALGDRVADSWIGARAYQLQTFGTAAALEAGAVLGAESSLGKVFWSELDVRICETALDLLGPDAELIGRAVPDGDWQGAYLFSLAGPIYAGTNEIQRTVIAERLLGLPR